MVHYKTNTGEKREKAMIGLDNSALASENQDGNQTHRGLDNKNSR